MPNPGADDQFPQRAARLGPPSPSPSPSLLVSVPSPSPSQIGEMMTFLDPTGTGKVAFDDFWVRPAPRLALRARAAARGLVCVPVCAWRLRLRSPLRHSMADVRGLCTVCVPQGVMQKV